jgi:hypothetical protein
MVLTRLLNVPGVGVIDDLRLRMMLELTTTTSGSLSSSSWGHEAI